MGVQKYRRLEDVPDSWRDTAEPPSLRAIAFLLALGRQLAIAAGRRAPPQRLQRFHTLAQAQAAEDARPGDESEPANAT